MVVKKFTFYLNKPKNGLGRDPQDLEQVWWNYFKKHSFLIKPKYLLMPKYLIWMDKCSLGTG